MVSLFEQIYSNGALLILWGAMLFHFLLPIPATAHPARLWREFARILADKVNTNTSYSQSLLSGSLAWMLMILPALILIWALEPLVWQPELFELALLLLAIDWRGNEKLTSQLSHALAHNNKQQARELLAPVVNRQTSTLSVVGLGKAGAETIIMGYGRNVISVLFWYAIGGGAGAFIYRLAQELARAWSPSRHHFKPFGHFAVKALATLDIVPLCLFSLLVLPGRQMKAHFIQMYTQAKSWPLPGPAWLLTASAAKLELSIGGPAIYPDKQADTVHKSLRAKLGGRVVPSALHLSALQKLLENRILIWFALQNVIMLFAFQGI
ncbi:cobalamin biosynthesis family protein [Vibrio albus]|uniref:Cobalamin biosynthesis family protein n=1 Tax=Vibrio albus TaxID=2200953 RepID=A0A2U3BF14_9VIBR|nr:cobalamin biosynthesis family protein [Vibrio albus]PWI35342.1 cobalamin biosynthesis family protein [Vibrio albus]